MHEGTPKQQTSVLADRSFRRPTVDQKHPQSGQSSRRHPTRLDFNKARQIRVAEEHEALHPETKREATLKRGQELPSRQLGETGFDRLTADTAAMIGQSGPAA